MVSFFTSAGPDAPMNSGAQLKSSNADSVICWLKTNESILYGPAPTGLRAYSAGDAAAFKAVGEFMPPRTVGHRVLEAGVRLLEVDLDGVVVDDRGAGVGPEHGQRSARLRGGVDDVVEGGLDRRGVERRPVLELDALAQLQPPRLAVGRGRPLRDQAGVELALVVVEQRLVDVDADPAVDRQARGARIEIVRRRRDADAQAGRRGRVSGARVGVERRQTARQRHGRSRGAHSGGQLHDLVLL